MKKNKFGVLLATVSGRSAQYAGHLPGHRITMRLSAFAVGLSMALVLATASTRADAAEEEWEFALSPLFLWGLSIDGDATINGNTAPLDLDFQDDILENMEAVFTLHFEARRGDWGFFSEYQYVDLEPEVSAQLGPATADIDIGFESTIWELGAAWAFQNDANTRWELLMGARYTDQDISADIDILALSKEKKLDGGDDWWHGFGGVRVFQSLSEKWTFIGRADLGYGGSDNSALNLAAMFDYRFNNWGSVFVGYKYLDYDYESSDYGFDAVEQGPLAGLMIHW
ncbi:MAG: hypothetical protein GY875_08390 [Gammaproteobacteria bacterium]|nr:hypothetical protein [Gammaproteobacteria bacterium]